MFGAIISGALGAMGGIMGGIGKNDAISRQTAAVNKLKRDNQDWYNRRYNEDATQRADAQRMITLTEEAIRRRNRAAEGRKILMGGTDESVSAEKERNNEAMANVVSSIAAAGDARKDRIEQQYLNRKNSLDDQRMGLDAQRVSGADMANAAIGGAANAIGNGTASGIDELLGGYKKRKDGTEIEY